MQILWPRLTAMPPLGASGRAGSPPSCSAPLPQASSCQCAVAIRSPPLAFHATAVKAVVSARRRQGCRRISIASACRRDLVISADPASSHAATAASAIRPALAPRPPPQLDRIDLPSPSRPPADAPAVGSSSSRPHTTPPPQLDCLACHRRHATPADSHPSKPNASGCRHRSTPPSESRFQAVGDAYGHVPSEGVRSCPVEWCRTGPHRCGAFNEGGHRVSLCVAAPSNKQGRNDAMAVDQAALSKGLSALKTPRRADTPRRW